MADISKINPGNGTTYTIKDASAVSNLSVSGTNLTVIRRNNTEFTVSLPDEKVKQFSSTTNQFMPILGAYATTPTSGNSGQAYYNQNIAINTATNTIKVNACQMTYDAAENCMKFTFNN